MQNLQELRAMANEEEQANKPEEQEQEEVELEEPEAEEAEEETESDESESETEAEDEALDELELEPDGEADASQHTPNPEEALLHKLSKKQRKLSKANSTIEELEAKIAALENAQRGTPQQSQSRQTQSVPEPELPRVPVLYEEYKGQTLDTPEQYTKAYADWMRDVDQIRHSTQQRRAAGDQYRQQVERKTLDLARSVSKFATEHKMKDDYVVNAVQRATEEIDAASGVEGAFAHLLDAVGEGSAKAAIYVGSKDSELEKVKQLLAEDQTGLKAVTYLTRIATRKPASRKISRAPEPDQPIKGDGAPMSSRKLQEQYDKASVSRDMAKMREIKRKAERQGVELT